MKANKPIKLSTKCHINKMLNQDGWCASYFYQYKSTSLWQQQKQEMHIQGAEFL